MNHKKYAAYIIVFLILAGLVYLQFRTWQNFDWAKLFQYHLTTTFPPARLISTRACPVLSASLEKRSASVTMKVEASPLRIASSAALKPGRASSPRAPERASSKVFTSSRPLRAAESQMRSRWTAREPP